MLELNENVREANIARRQSVETATVGMVKKQTITVLESLIRAQYESGENKIKISKQQIIEVVTDEVKNDTQDVPNVDEHIEKVVTQTMLGYYTENNLPVKKRMYIGFLFVLGYSIYRDWDFNINIADLKASRLFN